MNEPTTLPDIPWPASRPWTPEEEAYLQAHYATTPVRAIAEHLGRSYKAVQQRAGKRGLKGIHRAGTHSARHDYFAHIDTPEKAYVLGLLMADGYVTRANQIFLAVSAKDVSAVEFVRDQIAPEARIRSYATSAGCEMVRFSIQSARLAADLAAHSVTPAKSLTVTWPSAMPEEYANSFVLGLFDGDGSLVVSSPQPRWTITGASAPLLEAVQQRAFNQTGVWIGGIYRDRRSRTLSIVTTGRRQVGDIDEWVHEDVPGLARKRYAG